MVSLHVVLLVFAFVLFVLSALPPASAYGLRLIGAGLACAIATLLLT